METPSTIVPDGNAVVRAMSARRGRSFFSSLPPPRDSTALGGKKPKHTPPVAGFLRCCGHMPMIVHKYITTDLMSNPFPH